MSGVAIIGGGIGGVTCAYLLGPDRPVDLFEALPKLGGHADTEIVKDPDGDYHVDVGAQFFHTDTHPLYVCLLRQVGLFDDSNTETGMSRKMTGSLSIFEMDSRQTRLSSASPFGDPISGGQFYGFTVYARKVDSRPWTETVNDAVTTLPLSLHTAYFTDKILMPWLSSAVGAPLATIKQASIRSSLQGFARSFPAYPWESPITYSSAIGLGGNVQHIAGKSGNLTPKLNTPVKALTLEGGHWYLNTDRNRHGPYDTVIVNAPPHDSVAFFEARPSIEKSGELVSILKRYKYFDSNISIHRDPVYMPEVRGDWSLYNVGVTGSDAEGSVWHRPEHPRAAGQPTGIFKSWVTRRSVLPRQVIRTRAFKHPMMTPDLLNATRELKRFQGVSGLWFCGHFTTGFDLQESAVFSAMQVAEAINPQSATLKTFKNQIRERKLDAISYDVTA